MSTSRGHLNDLPAYIVALIRDDPVLRRNFGDGGWRVISGDTNFVIATNKVVLRVARDPWRKTLLYEAREIVPSLPSIVGYPEIRKHDETTDGYAWMLQQYIPGSSLQHQLVRLRPRAFSRVLHTIADILEAVHALRDVSWARGHVSSNAVWDEGPWLYAYDHRIFEKKIEYLTSVEFLDKELAASMALNDECVRRKVRVAQMLDDPLPLQVETVPVHNDTTLFNFRLTRDPNHPVVLLDWELAREGFSDWDALHLFRSIPWMRSWNLDSNGVAALRRIWNPSVAEYERMRVYLQARTVHLATYQYQQHRGRAVSDEVAKELEFLKKTLVDLENSDSFVDRLYLVINEMEPPSYLMQGARASRRHADMAISSSA